MFLFKKKPKGCLGIDVGASLIKIVELELEDKRYKLVNYAIFPLEKYLLRGNSADDLGSLKIPTEEMAEILQRCVKEAKFKARQVCISIPVRLSFSTLIDLPDMPDREVAAAIPFEARKYIPVPTSEVVLDWSVVNPLTKKPGRQVLLIAVPKEIVRDYGEMVQLAGLKLKAIEGETFSLSRVLVGNDKSSIVLIDAGARSVNISIIDGGHIRIIHNLEMGGLKVTHAIAKQMNLNPDEAEKIKKELSTGQVSASQVSQIKGVVSSSVGIIAVEIKKIIESYQEKYNRKIEKCIVVGGCVRLFGLTDYLTSKLSLDVSLGDPFARIIYPPLLKPVIQDLGPALTVAVGLAMR